MVSRIVSARLKLMNQWKDCYRELTGLGKENW
jgi:hypothetical protein